MGFWLTFCLLATTGAGLRYGIGGLQVKYFADMWPIPIGTLLVNSAGSLLIGYFYALPEGSFKLNFLTFPLIAGALLGSLTTFSGFAFETFRLFQGGQIFYGGLNIFLHNSFCIALCWLGFRWCN